jgi:hypothetical protein
MSTSKIRALLFCVNNEWHLQPMGWAGAVQTFENARAARRWAKRNNVLAIRDQNCDSK